MTLQDDFEQKLDKKLTELTKMRNCLDEWLPSLPCGQGTITDDNRFRILMPFDRKLMRELPALMAEQGFEMTDQDLSENRQWYPDQDFKKIGGEDWQKINVTYFDFIEGSVCKRQLIGKRTIEESVYEYTCGQE